MAKLPSLDERTDNRIMTEYPPVFTIGHSTRSIEAFVTLLRAGGVEHVVDIRTVPRSRTNPQYNLDVLADALAPYQITHSRIVELGGLRKRQSTVPPDVNGFWNNRSFHNYADYALSDEFHEGLDLLLTLAADRRTAIMCSEAVWWRCHRRLIADNLISEGRTVFHLMGEAGVQPATQTVGAVATAAGILYPAVEETLPTKGSDAADASTGAGTSDLKAGNPSCCK